VLYNRRTTRRAPTSTHQCKREEADILAEEPLIRTDAVERLLPRTEATRLITRRSQVQILPPPPSKEPAQRPFPRNREGPLTFRRGRNGNKTRTRRRERDPRPLERTSAYGCGRERTAVLGRRRSPLRSSPDGAAWSAGRPSSLMSTTGVAQLDAPAGCSAFGSEPACQTTAPRWVFVVHAAEHPWERGGGPFKLVVATQPEERTVRIDGVAWRCAGLRVGDPGVTRERTGRGSFPGTCPLGSPAPARPERLA
jgi:hypothetical protein